MGMFDEVYCYAELPTGAALVARVFRRSLFRIRACAAIGSQVPG
jgi:hypothetical protein